MVVLPVAPDRPSDGRPGLPDLALVRGQEAAKRALEVAAAGGHSLLLAGPMGAGKTMLARCFPGLLPPLTADEVSEVADLYARAGLRPPGDSRRPFRRVEPTLRLAELVGTPKKPGEVSLAGRGVLLLDDLRAHRGIVLRAISRIVEEGTGTVFAGPRSFEFPARFQLIATARLCPCGHRGGWSPACRCTPGELRRYWQPLATTILESLDLRVEVPALSLGELRALPGESTETVARRVAQARSLQADRFRGVVGPALNAAMAAADLARHCRLDAAGEALLDAATAKLGLSGRGLARVLRISRTIADLAGGGAIRAVHLAEAIQYRTLEVSQFGGRPGRGATP
jgi:magnesium chelatase family protein